MNICVTGGAGFIGSHIVDRLIAAGHAVTIIDNLSTGNRAFINEKANFLEMDIRDEKLLDVFMEHSFSYVFHEAAQTMVPVSMTDPRYDGDVNIMGFINVMEACRKTGVKKVLFPSSAAVYGDAADLPLPEDLIGVPSSFYGLTKLTGESYGRLYSEVFGLAYTCFRYSNVYGPRQGSGGEGGVISIFGQRWVKGQGVSVFGDGEQTRDFIYVDDVVEANIRAMENEACQGVYNVCTEQATSVNELLDMFAAVAGKKVEVTYGPERPGDIVHSLLSKKKSTDLLGNYCSTGLREGLEKTYAYFVEEAEACK